MCVRVTCTIEKQLSVLLPIEMCAVLHPFHALLRAGWRGVGWGVFNFYFFRFVEHKAFCELEPKNHLFPIALPAYSREPQQSQPPQLPIAALPRKIQSFNRKNGDKERHHNHLLAGKDHTCD